MRKCTPCAAQYRHGGGQRYRRCGRYPSQGQQNVGLRLARIALDHLYGEKQEYSGPSYKSMHIHGGEATIKFDQTPTACGASIRN